MENARNGTAAIFFLLGCAIATWGALIPFVKIHTAISDGQLGYLLLCLGLGALFSLPLAGSMANRFGCRAVITTGVIITAIAVPFLATLSSAILLGGSLLIVGASVGAIDAAMNIQSVIVEKRAQRPLISGFHALYSIGGAAGSAGLALVFSKSFSPLTAGMMASVLLLLILAIFWKDLLPDKGEPGSAAGIAIPKGMVWILSIICCIAFLAEGAVLDWGGVFLTSIRKLPPEQAGWGYAGYATMMTTGRLFGNKIIAKLGNVKTVFLGSLLAMAGYLAVIFIPYTPATFIGYALIGLGCADIVPVVYSVAGRQNVMPSHLAISAVTTIGYMGVLAGPIAIGFIANVVGLKISFFLIAALLAGVAVFSKKMAVQ
ncbi:fucose permease [Zymomonas mobilis]|uniref:MFS transporter n=1 Tax=Zymomonas mobilis TaxID=542 RepID=UPI000B39F60D|nr:MFS transporter [Zymomonas mobilis]ART94196.1 MFS transporter [Zymomonas mobilis subsp. mobilis]TWD59229.1 fucose permease [Zymomonas mobilis]